MSVPSNAGGRYLGPEETYPYDGIAAEPPISDFPSRSSPPARLPYDNVLPDEGPQFRDPRYPDEMNRNPDGADAGPLYMTPDAEQWYQENVIDKGWAVDWGSGTIIDEKGRDVMDAPRVFPRKM